ncbi:MAG: ABC1 kinase family protein [Arcobacter sp.]|uniref:ABC1 kinase family protein n=1 Tax=Arcobacter sp. TaxID=1872629 RepID=UPI003D023E6E
MIKISQAIKNTKRFTQILKILSKNGFDDILKKLEKQGGIQLPVTKLNNNIHLSKSQRIRLTIEELGSTYIKLAQMLSTRPDLISLDLVEEFEKLQDKVTPIDIKDIIPIFQEEFGKELEEIFSEPLELLATASIGQVYKGKLLNGNEVVVKVLKPNIQIIIHDDLEILKQLAFLFDEYFKEYGISSIYNIIQEFEKSIKNELNFKLETMNIIRFGELFKNDERIKVPKVYKEYSSHKIITMEFIKGIKVSKVDQLKQHNIEITHVAKNGFILLCEQIFENKFFHADPHPGNIFVTYDNKISFIDFGMMGTITKEEQRVLIELISNISQKETEKVSLSILNMTTYPNDIEINDFVKDMSIIINGYMYSDLKDINIKELFHDITIVISKYNISFKTSYYLFFRSISTIEGVGRVLDPEFNAVENMKPIVSRFYQNQFSIKNLLSKIKEFPKDIIEFLDYSPKDLKIIFQMMREGKFKVELEHIGLQKMEESIEKSFNRLTVSIIIASTLIGSSLLLLAKTPPLIYDIPLFGIVGFSTAVVMGLFLAYYIYKGGKL